MHQPRITALSLLVALAVGTPAHTAPPNPILGHPVEYVIVTSDALAPEFQRLADWKTESGVPAAVKTLTAIQSEYPAAADDAERVRLFLRDAWTAGARWALIGGDTGVLPVRYAWTYFYGGQFLPTDLYYSCLERDWNADGDALYGEAYINASDPGDDADLTPELWVGRAPVVTSLEAHLFVDKVLQYAKTPAGDYEHLLLGFAEVLFPDPWRPGDPITLDGAELVEENLPTWDLVPGLHVARLYENSTDTRWRPTPYPETRQAVLDSMTRGYNVVMGVGYGNSQNISVGDALLSVGDAAGLTNGARLSFFYLMTDRGNAMDSTSLGEVLILAPGGGAMGGIGESHYHFPTAARYYEREFFRLLHANDIQAAGEAHGRSKLPFIPFSTYDSVNRWEQMTLTLLGDPELRIWTAQPRALVVTHPPAVSRFDTGFAVQVEDAAGPVAGARVAAYQPGHGYAIATTDGAGMATVPFTTDAPGTLTLTVTAFNARPYQAPIEVLDPPVPVLATIEATSVEAGRVVLTWFLPQGRDAAVTVYRSGPAADWRAIATAVADGSGRVRCEDADVVPGARYGYRIGVATASGEELSAPVWIDVPAAALTLRAVGPNPASAEITLKLSLASSAPATIELLDVSGRRVAARTLGGLGSGPHTIRLGARGLPAGLYLIRLRQGHEVRHARAALIR